VGANSVQETPPRRDSVLRAIRARFPDLSRDRFAAHVAALVTSSVIAQSITALGTLALARLATPSDFGALALFLAVVYTLFPLASLRYENAILLPEGEPEAADIHVLCLFLLLAVSASAFAGLWLGRELIIRLVGREVAPWLPLASVGIAGLGLFQILSAWCTRRKAFRRLAYVRVVIAALTIGFQIGLVLTGPAAAGGLILGWVIGQSSGALILAILIAKEDGPSLRQSLNTGRLIAAFVKHRRFPLYTAPYSLVGNAGKQVTVLLLRTFSSIHTVGLFSFASRIVSLPSALVTAAMNQVFFQKAAVELRRGTLEPFATRLLGALSLLGIPVVVFFVFEANPLFILLFGRQWSGASGFAAILVISAYFDFSASWLDRIFDITGKQNLALVWLFSRTLAILLVLTVGLSLTHNDLLSIGIYAVTDFCCCIWWLIWVFRAARFRLGSLFPVARNVIVAGLATAALVGLVHSELGDVRGAILSFLIVASIEIVLFRGLRQERWV